ncbi:MAG TPA: hypothetical protein VEL11_03885, partial [Candidatus Bathyarchaeia archaeon]|nr:hypothetical protein [Candidatus Bathyarchaeia archaeon]
MPDKRPVQTLWAAMKLTSVDEAIDLAAEREMSHIVQRHAKQIKVGPRCLTEWSWAREWGVAVKAYLGDNQIHYHRSQYYHRSA